ncbi:hypothetical protein CVIRNUC_007882 [Coccomyxa viridis]|uniref:Mediator of RNA polymerase II transcription subunit 21 n=1 Tax=Coccomyxa viridis TaxID=1274662 RepID=A0AAV1IFJ8_9CHLO|nr:hypothetical protein CVIRNUC_007882 [Coccomyxa viridis]
MDLSRSRFLDSDVAAQVVAEHSNQQPAPVNDPHAVHDHVDGSEEAEAFLQPAFIGIISELSAITEGVLLPDSAHIEAEAKELQQRAEAAVHEAKNLLEAEQDRLLRIAGMVQLFYEQILQVLPKVSSGQDPTEM